jgi:hypothetical protein
MDEHYVDVRKYLQAKPDIYLHDSFVVADLSAIIGAL